MVAGALPMAGCFVLLVVLPRAATPLSEGLYLGSLTFVFFLFWTMVTVPYEALGAELSFDYDERSRLLGTREAAVLAGTSDAVIRSPITATETAPAARRSEARDRSMPPIATRGHRMARATRPTAARSTGSRATDEWLVSKIGPRAT